MAGASIGGVKTRLCGAVLVFLGSLDSLLSWRGGIPLSRFHAVLIAAGLFVYAIGAMFRRRSP